MNANKLIIEYNKNEKNRKKLILCSKDNLKSWLTIPKRIKKEIQGTNLEDIFKSKFVQKNSYIKTCQENYISETTFYSKTKCIYETAINYMFYERLFILNETVAENQRNAERLNEQWI